MTSLKAHQPIHFQGIATMSLQGATRPQRVMGSVLNAYEVSKAQGEGVTTLVKDMLTGWLPKSLGARTLAEFSENSLLEFVENGLVYFGMSALGRRVFGPLFDRVTKAPGSTQAKAATIVASLATGIIGGEATLAYAKRLFTAGVFKKSNFSDVVQLTNREGEKAQDQEFLNKLKRRSLQCIALASAFVGGAFLLARGKGKALTSLSENIVSKLDFNRGANGKLGLSENQMHLFMYGAIAPYLDSCSDSLERKEVASRLAIILPYLMYNDRLINKFLVQPFGKKLPQLLNADGKVKTLATLAAETPNKTAFLKLLSAKNALFFIPNAIALFGVGLGVTFLNRYWTARRFENGQQPQQTPALRPQQIVVSPLGLTHKPFEAFARPMAARPNAFILQ